MEIELARISMIEYAGMKIASPSWILLDLGKGLGPQLVFIDRIIQLCDGSASEVYFRAFLFTFRQLGATVEANRILVNVQMFQSVMDQAYPRLEPHRENAAVRVSLFTPNVPVRGLWIWTMARFAEWVAAPTFQHLHLASKDGDSIKFIFR